MFTSEKKQAAFGSNQTFPVPVNKSSACRVAQLLEMCKVMTLFGDQKANLGLLYSANTKQGILAKALTKILLEAQHDACWFVVVNLHKFTLISNCWALLKLSSVWGWHMEQLKISWKAETGMPYLIAIRILTWKSWTKIGTRFWIYHVVATWYDALYKQCQSIRWSKNHNHEHKAAWICEQHTYLVWWQSNFCIRYDQYNFIHLYKHSTPYGRSDFKN